MRERLLEAAAPLFAERGYDGVGVREIAQRAGVTPSMIGYYFGDKQGLLEAIFDMVFARVLAHVQGIAAANPDDVDPVPAFIRVYIDVIAREPWIPPLIMREILSRDTALRQRFVERFAATIATIVPPMFAREVTEGRLRRDLDPLLGVLSLVGMSVFPFLAHPVVGKALGYELDAEFRERLIAHTTRLYLEGAGVAS